eukprot:gene14605-14729_t
MLTSDRPILARGLEFTLSTGGTGFVGEYIGGGGQGAVYAADCSGRKLALKWYHQNVPLVDVTLRSRLVSMIRQGAPDQNFVWPLALVEIPGTASFGYVMPLISSDRRALQDMFVQPPKRFDLTLAMRATACLAIATSFQNLHATGYCYQDINFGGFFVDPQRGSIQICDADNIAVDGVQGGVYGTRKFMAPEVLRREAIPSTRTDLYSMAVLFFYMLFNWHPLDGKRESEYAKIDQAAEMELYGRHPLFMFDAKDASNGPLPQQHDWVVARWKAMPETLRLLFARAFTGGLMQPEMRPLESEWRAALGHLRESVVACDACGFEHGVDRVLVGGGYSCVTCRAKLSLPPLLSSGNEPVLLKARRKIFEYQLATGFIFNETSPLASVESHPRDTAILGLLNTQPGAWSVSTLEKNSIRIEPGKTVRIIDGLVIDFGGRQARSAHGAAHIQHEKPNQDAFSGMNLGGWTLIAVADGHGAAPHFRSDRGARMAVEAAHLAAAQFTRNGQADINEIAELRANLPVLIASIVRLWRVAVLRDVEADPLISEAGQDPFLPYGSTCVLAAFTADMSLFVQIGDGDIVVTAADGKLVGPLPEDTEPTGNQTYSLCQPDAAEHFRSGLFTAPHPAANPTFAMIATDGLAKSFIQRKKLLDIVQRWRKIVADHGMPAACVGLQDWLSNVSLHGNGDDPQAPDPVPVMPPVLPEMPPTPRDFAGPSVSELLPFTSKKINIVKSGLLVPAAATALTCTLLYFMREYKSMYTVIGTYILFITFYASYVYSGLRKPVLIYLVPCAVVYFEFATPIFHILAILFREILPGGEVPEDSGFVSHFISNFFGAGMLEELVKAVPALIGLFMGFSAAKSKIRSFDILSFLKVTSPIEGMLTGMAAGAAFIFIETLFQYVPDAYNGVNGFAGGFALLIPRVLQGFTGHMGWAAISGYFIGMAARYPRSMVKLLAVGWLVPAVLHGFWNSAAYLGIWGNWVSAALSLFLFIGCILKAKQLEAMRDGHTFIPSDSILAGTAPVPVAAGTLPEEHATQWGGLAHVFSVISHSVAPAAVTVAATPLPINSPMASPIAAPVAAATAVPAAPVQLAVPRFTVAVGAARFGILAGQTIDFAVLFPDAGLPLGSLAEVTVNPHDAAMLGLKNMTNAAWTATTPDGASASVSPGKNVKLVASALHFILVVDCSGSMTGDKIASLNYAIRSAIPALRATAADHPDIDVFVRVLSFSDGAKWETGTAQPVAAFEWHDLQAGGETDLGAALTLLASCLNEEFMAGPQLQPVIVLVSDGLPTDDVDNGVNRLTAAYFGAKAIRLAIAIGPDADLPSLQNFIGVSGIRPLQANNAETLVNHIKWAASGPIKAASAQTEHNDDHIENLAADITSQNKDSSDLVCNASDLVDMSAAEMSGLVARLFGKHGRDLLTDRRRFYGLLRDYVPTQLRRTKLLMTAYDQGIPQNFALDTSAPTSFVLDQAVQSIVSEAGIRTDLAQWAVDAWQGALFSPTPATADMSSPVIAIAPQVVAAAPVVAASVEVNNSAANDLTWGESEPVVPPAIPIAPSAASPAPITMAPNVQNAAYAAPPPIAAAAGVSSLPPKKPAGSVNWTALIITGIVAVSGAYFYKVHEDNLRHEVPSAAPVAQPAAPPVAPVAAAPVPNNIIVLSNSNDAKDWPVYANGMLVGGAPNTWQFSFNLRHPSGHTFGYTTSVFLQNDLKTGKAVVAASDFQNYTTEAVSSSPAFAVVRAASDDKKSFITVVNMSSWEKNPAQAPLICLSFSSGATAGKFDPDHGFFCVDERKNNVCGISLGQRREDSGLSENLLNHAESGQNFLGFISYRRRDGLAMARWLRDRITNFNAPLELREKIAKIDTEVGGKQNRVFFDMSYQKPNVDFWDEHIAASLCRSRTLILLQTPSVFERLDDGEANWCEREIETFLKYYGDPSRILVVMAPGAPIDRFPAPLEKISARWDWVDLRFFSESTFARFRHGNQYDPLLSKILAKIYDISDGDLPLLNREFEKGRARIRRALTVAAGAAFISLSGLTTWAIIERNKAAEAEKIAIQERDSAIVQRNSALVAQSRFLAKTADGFSGDGSTRAAIAILREALPDAADNRIRPLVDE